MHHSFFYLFLFLVMPSLCFGQIFDRLNSTKDDSPIVIDAQESVVCDETTNKCVATGSAKAQKGTNTVHGDILTVYFTEGKDHEITAMTADGHVFMETPTEKAYGDHAHYDVALDRVLLTGGNLKIETPKEILTARDSIEYWQTKNMGIARGHAVARFLKKEQLLEADTLVAYFKPSSEKTKTGEEKTEIDRIEAEGNMLASGPNGVVTGDRGVYFGDTEFVEVFNNVKVTQKGNVIEGGYAKANLKTNVAEMYPHPPHISQSGPVKRISGIIIPKDAKEMKEKQRDSKEKSNDRHKFPWSAKKKQGKSPGAK